MEQSQSPLPKSIPIEVVAEMTFPEAAKRILDGKKVHKLEWQNKEIYGFLNDGVLSLHKADGKNYQWILSDGDMAGEDYIVIQ